MPLRTLGLKEWLEPLTSSAPVTVSGVSMDVYPEQMANVIRLALTGGFGLKLEYKLTSPTFDAEFRAGGHAANRDAEEMAFWFDSLWIDADLPFDIGGFRVLDTWRVGGEPQRRRSDDSQRVYWGAPYGCLIER